MRIFELPDQLCAGGKPTVALLMSRPDRLTVSHSIYLGENAGGGDPTTYTLLASNSRFAQHGVLQADYRADTFTIDRNVGIVVQLDGPDTILDEQTFFRALSNEMLCVINDEIMSVIACELIGVASYRLQLIRRRFGTQRAEHLAGADVYLLPAAALLPIQHPHFEPGNTVVFKVTAAAPDAADDLSDVDPISLTLTGRIFELPPVAFLRVEAQSINPSFRLVGDISFDWVLPAVAGVDLSRAYTLLEFIEASVVVHTQKVLLPLNSLEYDYPATRPASFTVRASVVIERDWETISSPTIQLTAYHAEY